MPPLKQTMMWKGLMSLTMSLCLTMLTISPTLSAEDLLTDCVKVVTAQKQAINSQKVVIKKQKDLIKEQKKYIVKKEADASLSKLISGILSVIGILLVLL